VTLRITGTSITSDMTGATAEFRPHAAADSAGAWVCSTRPARLLTRNEAITAMTIADEQARPGPDRLLIATLESELA
jgi:hypothetical protein